MLITQATEPDLGYDGWVAAFDLARDHHAAGTVLVSMRWSALLGSDPEVDYADVAVPYGYFFAQPEYAPLQRMYLVDFSRPEDRRVLSIPPGYAGERSFKNPDVAAAYVEELSWFAARFPSDWLAIGVEVNDHYDPADPDAWDAFLGAFAAARARLQAERPALKVFLYWQLESLHRDDRWFLMTPALLDAGDALGISSYPFLAPVPDDYYRDLEVRFGRRPLVVAELGYPSDPDPAAQADFVDRFFAMTAGMNVALASWTGLHDASWGNPAFDSIALRHRDGTPKPAWSRWIAR